MVMRTEPACFPGLRISRTRPSRLQGSWRASRRACGRRCRASTGRHRSLTGLAAPLCTGSRQAGGGFADSQEHILQVADSTAEASAEARCNATAKSCSLAAGSSGRWTGSCLCLRGLNTCSVQCWPRCGAAFSSRPVRVVVVTTAPGWSMIRPASQPDLPARGGDDAPPGMSTAEADRATGARQDHPNPPRQRRAGAAAGRHSQALPTCIPALTRRPSRRAA